jgi:cell division septum initiation protein DivIVA
MTAKQAAAIGGTSYWARMTPEERSQEMKRRQKVAAKRGGHMVGFGVNKHTLSPKSKRAVQATLDELKLQKRKERDRLRHQKNRDLAKAKQKAPHQNTAPAPPAEQQLTA